MPNTPIDMDGENKIIIGHVVIKNLDKHEREKIGYSKRLEVDFDGPYLSLSKFDEIRSAIKEVFLRNIK